ncbi:MAG: hypothetical protein E7576_07255 [Ruminococcaceae bacterium]|nr:hypothetical protein [Oscillospiraceae bacterium]
MLRINIPSGDIWDEQNQEFLYSEGKTILLEHSLVSLAKWESRWKKPFFSKTPKTRAESIDYIRCMTLTPNVDKKIYGTLTQASIDIVNQYIADPMTATTFSDGGKTNHPSRETVTAELIYYWMTALQIPFECQNWHLNRLLTLIRVCNIKNQPKKKKGTSRDSLSQRARLNRERKARLGTTG